MGNEPAGAPHCWGKQFGEEDDECKNCLFDRTTCRTESINHRSMLDSYRRQGGSMLPQPRYSLPMFPQQPQQPPQTFSQRFGYNSGSAMPQPPPTNYPRPAMPAPMQAPQQPSVGYAPLAYQQNAPAGWNAPIVYLQRPNPNNPGVWQYSGESTRSRLAKNVILSALKAIFEELWRFFANWTWPVSLGTT